MMRRAVLVTMLVCGGLAAAAENSFYKGPALFSTRPSETKSLQTIDRFGPVGMGIELHQPAFVMKIKNIEEGSPAEATGKLSKGQIIETINGRKLADIDPRMQLGQILAAAEASDGVLKFMVKDKPDAAAQEVTVKIPVLGAYSKTWPLNCLKSDKIVRGFADYLARPGSHSGFGGIGMLFLLSTGEERDLGAVRKWAQGFAKKGAPTYAWHLGYGGIPLTEYYLRTGDQSVLPTIKRWADSAKRAQYLDGWAGRGGVAHVTYGGGGGHLNAGGTAVVTFLMLAKECGVDVDKHTLHSALVHFYRFAGRGNNPYGNNKPEVGFVDNGKNGNLAFAMAAAASLTPNGEQSVYAAARDTCAMTSFYTTTFMLHGHTGGGIGEIWRSAAMGLLHDKAPAKYREFMDNRRWHYELSRRWDGSFGILGGARYDNVEWGGGYALAYVIPRKMLRITGAPPSKFSKKYPLPKRPWGTEADDAFFSLEAATDSAGRRQDMSKETLTRDSAKPVIDRMLAMGDVSEDVLRRYVHHPDHAMRQMAANTAMGLQPSYMWKKPGGKIKTALVHELIRSKDPRVRRAAIAAMNTALPSTDPEKHLTREIFALLIKMLDDDEESWWVKDAALQLVGRAPADWVVPHVELLISFLKHEEWWLQNAALTALAPVVADERCYRRVLPAVGEFLRTCNRWNATAPVRWGALPENLRGAGPEVQKLAAATLREAYVGFTGKKTAPSGQNIAGLYNSQMEFLAQSLANVTGGYDLLYDEATKRFPNDPLPYRNVFLGADPSRFGARLKKAITPIIRDQLIYEFIGRNRKALMAEAQRTRQAVHLRGRVDDLADLYRKVGVRDHDWHNFGPDLRNQPWEYCTFEAPEKQAYDVSPWRYREVTFPKGMESWYAVDFDAAKAGWRKGLPPFGQYRGKLVTGAEHCSNADCVCKDDMRTLWDKEVLLVRKTFKVPPLRDGCIYRIRTGQGQHVGSGSGFRIYINGKLLYEVKAGNGRRVGGRPRGAYVTQDFVEEFSRGEVTIAAIAFLRYGSKAIVTMPPVPQGTFSIWLEEMKLPPLGDEAVRKSAAVIPMLTSKWQTAQDPDNAELASDDDLFRYDGKFVANPKVLGSWKTVALVAGIDEFDPAAKADIRRAPVKEITFKADGLTDSGLRIWSGDTLMDLDRYQALKMKVKTVGGVEYLFIEAGGFSTRNKPGWTSPWCVLKRAGG